MLSPEPLPADWSTPLPITLIGFGEAGMAISRGLRAEGHRVEITAYDIKASSVDPPVRKAKRADYRASGVKGASDVGSAVRGAGLILSTVTADQALIAAEAVARTLRPGTVFCDLNSCAPQTKQAAAEAIQAAQGIYADIAVMAPIEPRGHRTPMLIASPEAEAILSILNEIGMAPKLVGREIGAAAAIKLTRSIMIKGMEALTIECILAGMANGTVEHVLDSLDASFPGFAWRDKATQMIERVMTHGVRRAAELQEVARMLVMMGLGATMSISAARRQEEVGKLELRVTQMQTRTYRDYAVGILKARARSDEEA